MILTIIIILILIIVLVLLKINNKPLKEKEEIKIESKEIIEGKERLEAEEETNKVVYEMLRDINIIEYAKNNKKEKITLKELKETFKIDTTLFEKMKYNCSIENTYLKFNEDYSYSIIFDCLRLQRKSN